MEHQLGADQHQPGDLMGDAASVLDPHIVIAIFCNACALVVVAFLACAGRER